MLIFDLYELLNQVKLYFLIDQLMILYFSFNIFHKTFNKTKRHRIVILALKFFQYGFCFLLIVINEFIETALENK